MKDYKENTSIEANRFKNFSPEKKLDLAMQLYYSAQELKRAALKQMHPNWDNRKVEAEVLRIFLHART
ncbi:MAG: hypothetical protein KF721_14650 [Ignavibacteriaceae bacterium]|nr:hypothetical protein [Ignavibacteriaceae bacterium]HRI46118.1 hypothetical protein [Ignavibacteriaceae bacterium]